MLPFKKVYYFNYIFYKNLKHFLKLLFNNVHLDFSEVTIITSFSNYKCNMCGCFIKEGTPKELCT